MYTSNDRPENNFTTGYILPLNDCEHPIHPTPFNDPTSVRLAMEYASRL